MKIVYTYGVFDLLHVGHLELLEEAKELGDKLIVGVFTDEVASSFKRKPVIPFEQRIEMIGGLRIVDSITMQSTLSPEINIRNIKPDIVVKGPGADYENQISHFTTMFPETQFILADYHDGQSTSLIIKKIKEI